MNSNVARRTSVAVFGNSATLLVCGDRGDSVHLNYPALLHRSGEFDVADYSRIYGLISDCNAIWAYPLAQTRPDVVVLQFGLGESFPRVFPKVLNRALLGVGRHGSPVRDVLWRGARRLLMAMHAVERVTDAHLPLRWSRMSDRRFEHELASVCDRINRQCGARLVLMTAYAAVPPTPFLNRKMSQRLPRLNAAIERVAARVGADVFALGDLVNGLGPSHLPDGLHMDVTTHAVVADRLAQHLRRRGRVRAA